MSIAGLRPRQSRIVLWNDPPHFRLTRSLNDFNTAGRPSVVNLDASAGSTAISGHGYRDVESCHVTGSILPNPPGWAWGYELVDPSLKITATALARVERRPWRNLPICASIGDVPDAFFSKGEKVPESIDTGTNLITKENMNSKELLTPDVKK